MRTLNIPLLHVLVALGIGILAYDYFEIPLTIAIATTGILLFLLLGLHWIAGKKIFSEIPFMTGVLALFISLGYLTRERTNDLKEATHYSHFITTGTHLLLFSIEEKLKPTQYQDKYVARLQKIDSKKVSGKILINVSKDSLTAPLQLGEWLYGYTEVLPVPTPKNPYTFDYGQYLKSKEIYGQLSLGTTEVITSRQSTVGLRVWSSRFRESVQRSLHSYPFSKSQLAIMDALLLGQKQGIDKEMSTQYAAAGMMHILAVSGLHIGIILLILRLLTRPIAGFKLRWFRSLVIIILIWGFAFTTGLSPSVLRAATMFSFLEVGAALGGKRKTLDAVIVSAIFLLLYDPLLIYQVGFQLSYLAVLAILWIQPWLSNIYTPRFWIDKLLWGTATVTIAAQVGVLPLSLYYFHQFPGLFFVSNIVVLPFLTIILGAGILVAFLAYVGYLPSIFVSVYGGIIDLMNGFIGWVASQESLVSKHITISITVLIVAYLLLFTMVRLLKKFTLASMAISAGVVLLFTGVLLFEKTHPTASHLVILTKNKSTSLAYYKQGELKIYSNDSLLDVATDYSINAYRDALDINKIGVDSIQNYFRFKQKELLIIDNLGVYNLADAAPDFILLTQSPKININRLLNRYPSATIVADASNYRSYVAMWRATCEQRKIPFHSTYEKGAFMIE